MGQTRRGFVWELTAMAGLLAICNGVAMGQRSGRPPLPKRPPPEGPHEKDKIAETSDQDAAKQAARLKKENEFRAGVERLYQLSGELREDLQKAATSSVLSVPRYTKTEEIEKLAKKLKKLARES
jgi:hypothetical protein